MSGICTCGLLLYLRTLRNPTGVYPNFWVERHRQEDILESTVFDPLAGLRERA